MYFGTRFILCKLGGIEALKPVPFFLLLLCFALLYSAKITKQDDFVCIHVCEVTAKDAQMMNNEVSPNRNTT